MPHHRWGMHRWTSGGDKVLILHRWELLLHRISVHYFLQRVYERLVDLSTSVDLVGGEQIRSKGKSKVVRVCFFSASQTLYSTPRALKKNIDRFDGWF